MYILTSNLQDYPLTNQDQYRLFKCFKCTLDLYQGMLFGKILRTCYIKILYLPENPVETHIEFPQSPTCSKFWLQTCMYQIYHML